MKLAARIGLILLGIIALLIVVLAIIGVVNVRRPFPNTDTTLTIPGLQDEVNVYRDENGISHIYAENEHDLFLAQGYVHAQDRFWQMEFWRHVSQGRISEIAGATTVDSDIFIRTMGWHRIAQESLAYYERESPEMMAVLEAYSEGVNAYIAEEGDNISLSYTVLGLVNETWEIEPWEPLHTIAWAVVMADDLGGNWSDEIERANLIKELGEGTTANLLPFYPYDNRPVMVPTDAMDIEFTNEETDAMIQQMQQVNWTNVNTHIVGSYPEEGFLGSGDYVGSNNWVISGEHTDTGMPLLANDPHLGIQMPSIWYQVALHSPTLNVQGFSFAGVPGVVVGHNDHIAWGVTNVGPDVQDLYIEKINPNNPDQVEFMGEWENMEIIDEVIKVNGGEDVTIQVKITRHGPIISDLRDDTSDVLAMRWTAHEPMRTLEAIIGLNTAVNYQEFREALRFWDAPSQNFVYADTEGNIAYQMPGLVPIRANGNGLVPVPGWTGEYEWEGWVPYEELPAILNPEWGYIATANHAVVDEEYPYQLNLYWADGDRGQRIVDMIEAELNGDGELSQADLARIQFDSHSLLADSYVPLLDGLSSNNEKVQAALERLRGWDRQARRDSVPAALFEIFSMQLAQATLADEVGADNVNSFGGRVLFHQLAANPEAIWWDDTTTAAAESQADILLAALEDSVAWFEANVGEDMNDWTWGSIHTATFVSNPLGESGISSVESLVNRGPFPADGGRSIVNANSWSWSEPAAVTGHVSMRMLVDMSDFDASEWVIPTGQSGHPYHPNYDDQIQLWLDGEYLPMVWSRTVVLETAVNHLILQPGE
ncbi:MAG: penicillin acylase family protein [Candidatus Promineifilaceae bacterium]|nr:penicillin acylase family protein [Anaerolineaceae bacterium]